MEREVSNMEPSELISAVMVKNKLSNKQLASHMAVAYNTLYAWRKGKKMSHTNRQKLEYLFNHPVKTYGKGLGQSRKRIVGDMTLMPELERLYSGFSAKDLASILGIKVGSVYDWKRYGVPVGKEHVVQAALHTRRTPVQETLPVLVPDVIQHPRNVAPTRADDVTDLIQLVMASNITQDKKLACVNVLTQA